MKIAATTSERKAVIMQAYPHLTSEEIENGILEAAEMMMKLQKFHNISQAKEYVINVLIDFSSVSYAMRARRIFREIKEIGGWAVTKSFRKALYFNLQRRISIADKFRIMDWHNDPFRAKLLNARNTFYRMPVNSKVTVTQ